MIDTGPISHDEARQILTRYNNSHFGNHRDMGEKARYSIPADPRRDDDLRMDAYIQQQRERDAQLAASEQRVRDLEAVIEEALSPGVFGPWSHCHDAMIPDCVRLACDEIGYGAVMHHVEHLWSKRAEAMGIPGSEHTCAACASVRRQWIERARTALGRARA
jgi:hypothetical protein